MSWHGSMQILAAWALGLLGVCWVVRLLEVPLAFLRGLRGCLV